MKAETWMRLAALAVVASALSSAGLETAAGKDDPVKRGGYLVTIGGCNDCHTPLKMGPKGPEPDFTRRLSGHPAMLKMTAVPAVDMPWTFIGGATMTAWAGPWGVSYAANLTPDPATGLAVDEAGFVKAMRSGKHYGAGRDILPPMPWQNLAQATDDDLKAIYAYLRSLPPIENEVPEPAPPAAPPAEKH